MQRFKKRHNLSRIALHSMNKAEKTHNLSASSAISTFRQIKKTPDILQKGNQRIVNDKMRTVSQNNCRLTSKRNFYFHLSKPKLNYMQKQCQRNQQHNAFYQKLQSNIMKQRKLQNIHKTISFQIQKLNSAYTQNYIDLKNQEFKKSHFSLKNYEKSLNQDDNYTKNTILSNQLGKLSTYEIINIKEKREMQRETLISLIKFGHSLSNEPEESEELRGELPSLLVKPFNNENKITQNDSISQTLGKPVIEKYRRLLDGFLESEKKYSVESYEQYDKGLSKKDSSKRIKRKPPRIVINCVEEWR